MIWTRKVGVVVSSAGLRCTRRRTGDGPTALRRSHWMLSNIWGFREKLLGQARPAIAGMSIKRTANCQSRFGQNRYLTLSSRQQGGTGKDKAEQSLGWPDAATVLRWRSRTLKAPRQAADRPKELAGRGDQFSTLARLPAYFLFALWP